MRTLFGLTESIALDPTKSPDLDMSTYYATFANWNEARSTTDELLNGGVSPDDLSLFLCAANRDRNTGSGMSEREITESGVTVGDATTMIGRSDDPSPLRATPPHTDISLFASSHASRIGAVDTSDADNDVDSVDQAEDSQRESESMISPDDGISHSAHEKDDLALTVLTGFPTASSNFADNLPDPFLQGQQYSESLESIEIPGVGLVIGGGGLATAALDFKDRADASIVPYLIDEGVPEETAQWFQKAIQEGQALLAVEVTPGVLNESAVEEIARRHGATNGELYDAPRY